LKAYRKNIKLNFIKILYLNKLTEFLITHYALISEKLTALFKHKEIIFKLFLMFFRPNSVVYMVSANFEKSKYFMFDFGLMKATFNSKKYLKLSYRYLTYDGKCFRKAIITVIITEFHGVIKITLLEVYPFKHHAKK
jgi:hypothetical protein